MRISDTLQLRDLARAHGVLTSYLDMRGRKQIASPETLTAVLHALGVPAGNTKQIRDSLRHTRECQSHQCLPPVIVTWDKRPARISLHLPAASREIQCRIQLENGETLDITPRGTRRSSVAADVRRRNPPGSMYPPPHAGSYGNTHFTLPSLPFGYHTLEADIAGCAHRTLIICAPAQSYSEPGARSWGAFVPLYAVHSTQSWGAGNFGDWEQLCQWLGSFGPTVAATLPLLAAFLDHPVCEPGPYSPASRLFWNEFYLDIPQIPEFAACPAAQKLVRSMAFQDRLRQFRANPMIDYRAEWVARRDVLELLAKSFFSNTPARNTRNHRRADRKTAFQQFLRDRPEAEDYARFRAVCERTNKPWRNWPARLRDGVLQRGDFDESVRRFHLYTQWLAHEQINDLTAHCRDHRVQFYLDLPLGVHPDSYDIWRERESYALDASAGAPPDMFFTRGQDWGFPPLHPEHIREQGYRHFRDYLRFQMQHTELLRIDHVMGLHRLFWVPKGFPPAEGAYVRYAAEELYAILMLESHRHRTTLVGENLGTVPIEVNEAMGRHGLREMFVLQYEQQPNPKTALRSPPAKSVASLNTHDMPGFAAHWEGLDISDRHQLGLIPKAKLADARARRRRLNAALVKFLTRHRLWPKGRKPEPRGILDACLRWLSAGPAELVLVNLEDLWLEKLPQNVPGTSTERPNWRRKAQLTLETIQHHPDVTETLKRIAHLRKGAAK